MQHIVIAQNSTNTERQSRLQMINGTDICDQYFFIQALNLRKFYLSPKTKYD